MQYARGRGGISIPYVLTVAVALLAVVILGMRQLSRASARVVVARAPIAAGERIDASKLVLASVARNAIPAGALLDPAALLGRVSQRPVGKGAPITAADVTAPPPAKWLADAPPPGRVIVTLALPGTLMPLQQLRLGDQLDVMAVSPPPNAKARLVGRDVYFLGSMMPRTQPEQRSGTLAGIVSAANPRRARSGVGLVLAVRPEDVASLARAEASGDRITFALHGSQEIRSGKLLDVAPRSAPHAAAAKKAPEVELITGRRREKVAVQ